MTISPSITQTIYNQFVDNSGLTGIEFETKKRGDDEVLVIHLAHPTERLFKILQNAIDSIPEEQKENTLATLKKKSKPNILQSPEGKLLLRTLSESLNINQQSFSKERYIKSVFNAEEQIKASGNHIVFGRRGAGKSSLLLYAMNARIESNFPCIWVNMQVYANNTENSVIVEILHDILDQSKGIISNDSERLRLMDRLKEINNEKEIHERDILKTLPGIKRLYGSLASHHKNVAIFLDDFHVIDNNLQPRVLSCLYGFSRDNNVFLKISAIETMTKTWDSRKKIGLEIQHDVQTIKLDYNLTTPEKATEHIQSILDAHAEFCGLSTVRLLCVSNDVISRLVWVAAGVPRDALAIFTRAMTKATLTNRKHVSVTNVNQASSEMVNDKLRELNDDIHPDDSELNQLLNNIRDFCIKKNKTNALLVEIVNENTIYQGINRLVDHRLLHVISEGITVRDAGRKYLALVLDYGLYVGSRTARNVELFNKQTQRVDYKELRRLPIYGK